MKRAIAVSRVAPVKIISGGQTGADRAALDVALLLKLPCGGWCPADRRAEDGMISIRYPLTPLEKAGYKQRTRQNVIDSDGTVVFSFGPFTGGSRKTAGFAKQFRKPCLIIDASSEAPAGAALLLAIFQLKHGIFTLNVAGPRASGQPAIYQYVRDTLMLLLVARKKRNAKK